MPLVVEGGPGRADRLPDRRGALGRRSLRSPEQVVQADEAVRGAGVSALAA